MKIRFPRDTHIEIGEAGRDAMCKHRAVGLRPVILNGVPHLEITNKDAARVDLLKRARKTAILSLLVVVSPYRCRGENALYHIMEAIGDQVVGGVAVQFRV